jgi:protease-4
MVRRSLAVLLVLTSVTLARPATRPASAPASRPAALTTRPPTPGELLARIQALKEKQKELLQVAHIELDKPLIEKPSDFTLFADEAMTIQSVLGRLHQARDDKDIRAVLVTLGQTDFNLAQAQEVRSALVALRNAGKRTFVYADSYDTTGYIMASGATDVCMLGGGQIMIPGVGMEAMFLKGLLDKIGIKADYVQVGEYKGADEQYTRTEPSKELRGELNKLLDAVWEQIVDGIAFHRSLSRSKVEDIVDQAMLTGAVAKERRLVDHLTDIDGLRELIAKELGKPMDLARDYGLPARQPIDWSNPLALLTLLSRRPEPPKGPSIALIHVDGVIVDGEGGQMLLGGKAVGSDDLRAVLRQATRDDTIKALVLRIDSPGGSALASEAVWQAVRRAASEKPVLVSVGQMAASGGYYVACGGDRIVADPSAIVGSIGVVGGKFVLKELLEKKLDITTESFTRGRNADLFSSNKPFTESQRRLVTNWMKQTYDQFTERVMETRAGRIKDIDRVARGRIFLAKQALELGMIDQIGGLDDCIAQAAAEAQLQRGHYDVRVMPTPKTLVDLLRGDDEENVKARLALRPTLSLKDIPLLRGANRTTARLIAQQLQLLQLLEDRPVILATPFSVTIR